MDAVRDSITPSIILHGVSCVLVCSSVFVAYTEKGNLEESEGGGNLGRRFINIPWKLLWSEWYPLFHDKIIIFWTTSSRLEVLSQKRLVCITIRHYLSTVNKEFTQNNFCSCRDIQDHRYLIECCVSDALALVILDLLQRLIWQCHLNITGVAAVDYRGKAIQWFEKAMLTPSQCLS